MKKDTKTTKYADSPISSTASGSSPKKDTVNKTPAANGTEFSSRDFDNFLLNKKPSLLKDPLHSQEKLISLNL